MSGIEEIEVVAWQVEQYGWNEVSSRHILDLYEARGYEVRELMTVDQCKRLLAAKDAELAQHKRDAERMREAASFAYQAIQHLLHNIKASGKRIDLGLAKESALTALEMIDAVLNQQQAAQGCGACGDACQGKQYRVEADSPPCHSADKLEMVNADLICKFCVGTGKQPHVYDGSVPCESCKQDEVKL